jgi:hypothetical protein
VENGSFWAGSGRQLIAALLHAAALRGKPISAVHGWVAQGDVGEPIQLLERHGVIPLARTLKAMRADERHLGNVMHQARLMMAPYRSSVVRAQADAATSCGFDAVDFLSRPNTLFIVSPSDKDTDLSSLVVGLVEEVRAAALWLSDRSPTMAVPIPLLLALDETANISPLPSLDRIVWESRSRDIVVMCCFQTYGQCEQLFGGLADGFIFHGGCSVFLGPQGDRHVVERLHELGGAEWIAQCTTSATRSTDRLLGALRPWEATLADHQPRLGAGAAVHRGANPLAAARQGLLPALRGARRHRRPGLRVHRALRVMGSHAATRRRGSDDGPHTLRGGCIDGSEAMVGWGARRPA